MNVCRLPLVAHPACFARLHAVQCISQNLRADILCLYAQYHDDGERGLGQFVASVSLGSDAIMSFRSKAAKKPRRAAAKAGDEVDTDADADDEGDDGASGKKGKGNKSRVVLKARLKHGHVLIMEVRLLSSRCAEGCLELILACSQGTGMQKLYEHKVEPEGLRFGGFLIYASLSSACASR